MKNLLICLLLALLGCGAASAACTTEKTTTLVFGNGIDNSYDEAWISLHVVLRPAVSLTAGADVDKSCIGYWLAYNSTFVDKNNSNAIQRFDNLVAQLVDSTVQQGVDFAASYWGYFYSALGTQPSWFADVWRTSILSATSVFQPDLVKHEAFYNSELALGHKVIAVAHSQGNFYVNQAYTTVTALGGADKFKVIGVATPAISVAGSGPYFTLVGDVITLVPGSLAPNIVNGPPSPCLTPVVGSVACHSFDSSYMGVDVKTQTIVGGDSTRPAIVSAIVNELPRIIGNGSPSRDIWTTSVYSYTGAGGGPGGGLNNDELVVGGWGDEYRSLLQFDLAALPKTASSVTLRLFDLSTHAGSNGPSAMYLDQVTSDWDWTTQPITPDSPDNLRLWWVNRPASQQIAIVAAPTVGQYYDIDITALYNQWQSGTPNFGVQLRPTNTNNAWNVFGSSEHADATRRPQLIVTAGTPPPPPPPPPPPIGPV